MTRAGTHDRAAMAAVRHRCQGRCGAGHAARRAAPPATSTPSSAGASRPGAATRTCRYFLDSWHSQFVAQPGKPQPPRNWQRWSNPELDKIIEQIRDGRLRRSEGRRARPRVREARRAGDADHPADVLQRVHGDGRDLLDRISDRGDDPYTDPVPNWGNSRYMMVRLKPRQLGAMTSRPPTPDSRCGCPSNYVRHARCAHERIPTAICARRLGQFVLVVFIGINLAYRHHARDADRSGRADDRGRHLVRQHQPGGDRA